MLWEQLPPIAVAIARAIMQFTCGPTKSHSTADTPVKQGLKVTDSVTMPLAGASTPAAKKSSASHTADGTAPTAIALEHGTPADEDPQPRAKAPRLAAQADAPRLAAQASTPAQAASSATAPAVPSDPVPASSTGDATSQVAAISPATRLSLEEQQARLAVIQQEQRLAAEQNAATASSLASAISLCSQMLDLRAHAQERGVDDGGCNS